MLLTDTLTPFRAQGSDLDFWDLDFEGEKPENEKDLTANLQLVASGDHYGVTEVKVISISCVAPYTNN